MVSRDRIRDDELSQEELLDLEVEQPQEEVKWRDEWDDHPEELPGENTHIEDDVLYWERNGFEAELESIEITHWKAVVQIPEEIGKWSPREIDIKCNPLPEYGYVESAEIEEYHATQVTLIIQENFQPIYEVNKWIDAQIENAENGEAFQEELGEKMELARETTDVGEMEHSRDACEKSFEERDKEARKQDFESNCPECGENIDPETSFSDEPECPHCNESLEEYIFETPNMTFLETTPDALLLEGGLDGDG